MIKALEAFGIQLSNPPYSGEVAGALNPGKTGWQRHLVVHKRSSISILHLTPHRTTNIAIPNSKLVSPMTVTQSVESRPVIFKI
jgi:hypothetical protein